MLGCTFCTVHAKTAKLSNPKASKEARKLYKTLQSFHAQGKTLSGQMWAPWGIDEIEFVYKETGKYPAVRGHATFVNANEVQVLPLQGESEGVRPVAAATIVAHFWFLVHLSANTMSHKLANHRISVFLAVVLNGKANIA